ncbi:MAG: cell division ATPase MinD [Candidatus Micrarchaeia archaeon]
MTRLVCCSSAKGGVGKTTIVSNLAAALADFGEETIAIDANLSTPNLGLHTGMHLAPITLHHVLRGEYPLRYTIYSHPYGFKIIPASLKLSDLNSVDPSKLPQITFSLLGKASYILLDTAAGLGREALSALSSADELLIVTNPTLPAVTDALKLAKIAKSTHIKSIGVVVNRVKNTPYELSKEEIEEILSLPVISQIPEDPNVEKCIQQKKLLFEVCPNSPAAIEIKKLAAFLSNRKYEPPKVKESIISKLFKILRS